MTSFNSITTQVALAMGIEIGSPEWEAGGVRAYSGSTGGHSSYGWRRHEEMTEDRCRAVLSNYAARGAYYDPKDHPKRKEAYEDGCRPHPWDGPEDAYDLPGGGRGYMTSKGVVKVTGPDIQHFWIDPLLDVIDRGGGITVPWPSATQRTPAALIARGLACMLTEAMTGMLRHVGQYQKGGRSFARVVDTHVTAAYRGCLTPTQVNVFLDWLVDHALPFLETAPGVYDSKWEGRFRIYQDISWVGPALWDLSQFLTPEVRPEDNLYDRVETALERVAQWCLDIHHVKGGSGGWSNCDITPEIKAGDDGKTLATIREVITPDNVSPPAYYDAWAVRMADVCRAVYPGTEAEEYRSAVVATAITKKHDPMSRVWLVDRNRAWIPELGVTDDAGYATKAAPVAELVKAATDEAL